VISGNTYNGVVIAFSGASYNLVAGDFIGTNAAGSAALPNGSDGVVIQGGASENTIGGGAPADRDVISGNGADGVEITDSGTTYNVVEGDFIGLDTTGTRAVPNDTAGVIVQSGASGNYLFYDVISANLDEGVLITGSGTNGNVIAADFIGTNAAGNAVVLYPGESDSNGIGVEVSNGPAGTLIEGNVIGGNNVGVEVYGNATTTSVVSNDIGTDVTGRLNLGNLVAGLYLYDTSGNMVEDDTIDDSEYGIVTIEADQNTIADDTYSGNQDGNRLTLD
jgi:titin